MRPDAAELAATAAADAGDPLGALTALSDLRSELDRVEREQVALALDAGWSWAAIANALGISRQAAHKKHRSQSSKPLAPPTKTLKRARILVTSEARSAVRNAREEARRCGTGQVGTEHLLLGILRCDYSVAVRALTALRVKLKPAREAAAPTLAEEGPDGNTHDVISPAARAALEQSLREATRRGDGYLGVEHLLLSIIRDNDSGATRTLEALGTTPEKVRDALERETAV